MSRFPDAPEAKTALGKYRVMCPKASVRISPLFLGAMSLGSAWSGGLGTMTREDSMKLLDAFYEAGGNAIDTANNYQDMESEQIIGDWMETKGNRDEMVIASKYTSPLPRKTAQIKANMFGNGQKPLTVSLASSLKNLKTTYLDILYVHWWDNATSIPEMMHALDIVVKQGKVLYLGISDTPAWIVSAANMYARDHALTPFVIYQGKWSARTRDMERDIIPMCRAEGMAIAPWNALGGGAFKTKAQLEQMEKAGDKGRSSKPDKHDQNMTDVLEKIGKSIGSSHTAVALAWIMAKEPYVFPIIGGRKLEHLKDNIEALKIRLTKQQMEEIENVVEFDLGFPNTFHGMKAGENFWKTTSHQYEFPREETSISAPQ